jgi:hypothetical protein
MNHDTLLNFASELVAQEDQKVGSFNIFEMKSFLPLLPFLSKNSGIPTMADSGTSNQGSGPGFLDR